MRILTFINTFPLQNDTSVTNITFDPSILPISPAADKIYFQYLGDTIDSVGTEHEVILNPFFTSERVGAQVTRTRAS